MRRVLPACLLVGALAVPAAAGPVGPVYWQQLPGTGILLDTGAGIAAVQIGAGLSLVNGTLAATGGGTGGGTGTVTSVGLALPSIFTVTGSPVTGVGTLTGTLASEAASTVLAAPAGAAGVPSFRGLTAADIGGLAPSATTDTTNASNITSGTLAAARLPASGVTAGTYGSATTVPALTIGAAGTVTSAASDPIAFPVTSVFGRTGAVALTSGDVVGALGFAPLASIPAPSAMTLGGVESVAPAAHEFVTGISTAGVPSLGQPAAADVSGLGALATAGYPAAGIVSSSGSGFGTVTVGSGLTFSAGTLSAAGYTLPTASTTTLGGVKVDGSTITISSGGVISAVAGGSGTVSSVGLALPSIFTVTGSPVTGSGTLTGTLASEAASTVLAAPAGAAGVPSFRGLTAADIGGLAPSATTDTTNASNITSGTLAAARLPASGVTAGTYGSATTVPQITVDSTGRITSAGSVAVSGGGGSAAIFQPQGRLTLTSGSPVMTSDVVGATTIYYDDYSGNAVPIYNGTASAMYPITGGQLSLALNATDEPNGVLPPGNQAGTITYVSGGTMSAHSGQLYYTLVTPQGETTWENAGYYSDPANELYQVPSPPPSPGVTAYNVYTSGGGYDRLQNSTPIPIGTAFTEPFTGFQGNTALPPDFTQAGASGLYDVFVVAVAGAPELCAGSEWTTTSTRAVGVHESVTGYWTNSASLPHCYNGTTDYGPIATDDATYLGTFYSTGSGGATTNQFEPAYGQCLLGLYNAYHRAVHLCEMVEGAQFVVTTLATAPWDNNYAGQFLVVDGLARSPVLYNANSIASGGYSGHGCDMGFWFDLNQTNYGNYGNTAYPPDLYEAVNGPPFVHSLWQPQSGLTSIQPIYDVGNPNCTFGWDPYTAQKSSVFSVERLP